MVQAEANTAMLGSAKVHLHSTPVDSFQTSKDMAREFEKNNNLDAFTLCNMDTIVGRFDLWKRELPQVEPFFAVKSNPDPVVLRTLATLGTNFDCASKMEIDDVLSLGVSPDRIVFANPAKSPDFIQYAEEKGVHLMTFDNSEELEKIIEYSTKAKVILRIAMDDPTAMSPLTKFGAEPKSLAPELLKQAHEMGVNVHGISFHVGSGCRDATTFQRAIEEARNLFDLGTEIGHKMTILDVGGGFPGGKLNANFGDCAASITKALDVHFANSNVRVIAEPGRFFSAAAYTVCANVIHATKVPAERITKNEEDVGSEGIMYYLNDGVFGSFFCILFGYLHSPGLPLFDTDETADLFPSTIWGPTCDTFDKIEENKLMRKLKVGDWLYYRDMGAYSCCLSTTFNGFLPPHRYYAASEATCHTGETTTK